MRLLAHMLRRFVKTGRLTIIDAKGRVHNFGDGGEPSVALRLTDPSLHRRLFLNPELALGEGYMDGTITFETGELRDFLLLFSINSRALGAYPLQAVLRRTWKGLKWALEYNPIAAARRHVAHHYDLSGKLYELFLDQDLQYSCAYFQHPGDSLEQAQENKKRHIAAKLRLSPGQEILDIGCGWGGLALYLASIADVQVLGITLSREQMTVARARAEKMGMSDRVRFELCDYREVRGKFDRIVSVGMFEHVGVRYYPEFFARLRHLLTEDGIALVHSIGHRSPPGTTSPWLRKYIFPGGYSPALSEVFGAVEKKNLWVTDVEILRLHYADTLREWQIRFAANRDQIKDLYDERFCRMWWFYLVVAEMTFRHGSTMVFQMQLTAQRDATPLTRDYMTEDERALASSPPAKSA